MPNKIFFLLFASSLLNYMLYRVIVLHCPKYVLYRVVLLHCPKYVLYWVVVFHCLKYVLHRVVVFLCSNPADVKTVTPQTLRIPLRATFGDGLEKTRTSGCAKLVTSISENGMSPGPHLTSKR